MRLRVSSGVAVLAAALAFTPLASVASATTRSTAARDASSTRAFIASELGIDRAMIAHAPAELAAGKAYVAGVERECGDVRLRPPRKWSAPLVLTFLRFGIEASAAYQDVAMAPARPAIDRIVRAQRRLRFSDPTLQWLVHGSTPARAAMLALRPPGVCADARRLAATKFKSMTLAGRRFSKDVLTLAPGQSSPAGLMRRMRSYAPSVVANGLRRLKTLDHRTARLPVIRVGDRLLRRLLGPLTSATRSGGLIGTNL